MPATRSLPSTASSPSGSVPSPTHSSIVSRDSVTTASVGSGSPKTVSAKASIAAGFPPSPSVADVATGVTLPSGRIAARTVRLQREAEAPQQHRHIGALRAIVGVKLVEDEVLQRLCALRPDPRVRLAQQQLVEHLVVRQQDVRRAAAHDRAVGDQAVRAHPRAFGAELAGEQPGGHAAERGVRRDELREALRLVVGERVHRIEDQRLHPADAARLGAQDVVEDRVEERLGLARPGARRDERRAAGAARRDRGRRSSAGRRPRPDGRRARSPWPSSSGCQSSASRQPSAAGRNGSRNRRYGPLKIPSSGCSRNSSIASRAGRSDSENVVSRYSSSPSRMLRAASVGSSSPIGALRQPPLELARTRCACQPRGRGSRTAARRRTCCRTRWSPSAPPR